MAEEAKFLQEQEKYEYLQYVIPDTHSIARGKIVKGEFKEKTARQGFQLKSSVCHWGPNGEYPISLNEVFGDHFPNHDLRPCLDTLTPWPWVGGEGRGRVGNVLCDLLMHDGSPDLTSPRQLLKAQLETLRERHGLLLKSAFEYEFTVFKEGLTEPLGGDDAWCWDTRIWGRHYDLFSDLLDLLEVMGVKVSSLMPETYPGQWELTTEPQEGLRGGDVGFYVKNAVKGFFPTRGLTATFLPMPLPDIRSSAALQLNHSLWTRDGNGDRNVLQDDGDPQKLSPTARHWIAGILHHAPALTALCCPTLNCYRQLFHMACPGKITWGVDDRTTVVRVKTANGNVYLENRLPSGPSSPYLVMAGTVAAGLDGLDRQLACPPPRDVQEAGEVPRTLAHALDALEKDQQLCSLLGDRFVSCYIRAKRENDLQQLHRAQLHTEQQQFDFERRLYMRSL